MSEMQRKNLVLLVEDCESDIDTLLETLEKEHDIAVAMDGETALEAVQNNRPDLILLDIMLPGMDGYEVCRRLKNNSDTSDIPVIFVTAKDEEDDEATGFALGGVDYISKPFSPALVRARVQTHLQLKAQRDQLRKSISLLEHEKEMLRHKAELGILAGCLAHDLNNIFSTALYIQYVFELIPADVNGKKEIDDDIARVMESLQMGCDLCRGYTSYLQGIGESPRMQALPPLLRPIDIYVRKFKGRLERQISNDLPLVCCKGDQLKRVFVNLFLNALQAVEERKDGRIALRLWPEGGRVFFSISDNGPGIDEKIRGRIFEERFTTKKGGTGLGLYLVKQIVDAHNGTIEFRPGPEGGAIFILSFPAAT